MIPFVDMATIYAEHHTNLCTQVLKNIAKTWIINFCFDAPVELMSKGLKDLFSVEHVSFSHLP